MHKERKGNDPCNAGESFKDKLVLDFAKSLFDLTEEDCIREYDVRLGDNCREFELLTRGEIKKVFRGKVTSSIYYD